MSSPVPVSVALLSWMLCLDLRLLDAADAASTSALLRRLAGYLAGSDLTSTPVHGRLLVVAVGRPLTRLDRGMPISWLIEQPEVTHVTFTRPGRSVRDVLKEIRHDA